MRRKVLYFCVCCLAAFSFTKDGILWAVPGSPNEAAIILTPAAPTSPLINGPKVYGVRPGAPFLYRIPCTGKRPITFSADGLPVGLSLNNESGIITGQLEKPGKYQVILLAKNAWGSDQRGLQIVVGNQLALTPPMGWNSWYIHYHRVSDQVMRQAADQMIATGMADYGYQYVNIDDCWMRKEGADDPEIGGPIRDADGRLLPNQRFPDMKALTDYIHSKGLKAGTYISPGPRTCQGFAGSFGHEALDAVTFATWGFDFLKYDWCSYSEKAGGKTLEDLKKPYQVMWTELQRLNRDMVHNLCQYGMGEVWKWGAEFGHCWRTTDDLGLEKADSLPGFYRIGMKNAEHWEYAHPGAWNDPDYILIGWVGNAHQMGEGTPTQLTPHEQYAYMSMWCLMAAPLIFSGDMAKLDAFTLNVLCNHEVIEIDQDPLGKQARIVKKTEQEFLLAKDLEDGSKAVGLFNLTSKNLKLKLLWSEIGLSGKQRIRDLWRQRNVGVYNKVYNADIPSHGVAIFRFWPVK